MYQDGQEGVGAHAGERPMLLYRCVGKANKHLLLHTLPKLYIQSLICAACYELLSMCMFSASARL